ncbi:MAG: hypothetical protein IV100_31260 [Myxococcales bacterium]|nr:hypothetical protein [Myxococcales bacterium]
MSSPTSDAVAAGRGFLVIAGSKAYFILSAAAISLGLPRLFGDPARFGEYRVVNGFATLLNMVVITAGMQATARVLTQGPGAVKASAMAGAMLALATGVAVASLGPWIAGTLLNDPSLGGAVALTAAVVAAYSLYGVVVGVFNGARRFASQALLDITFSTFKLVLVVGAVAAGFGLTGAILGFASSVVLAMVVGTLALARSPLREKTDGPPVRLMTVLAIMAPFLGTQLLTNLLIQLDGIAVKSLLAEPLGAASRADLTGLAAALGIPDAGLAEPKRVIDWIAGVFGGAKNVALLPYQATFALTLVVFPLVTEASRGGDPERSRLAARGSLRFTALLGGMVVSAAIGPAESILGFLFGDGYVHAGVGLRYLLVSGVLLSLLSVLVVVLNAYGREGLGLMVTATAVVTSGLSIVLALAGPTESGTGIFSRLGLASCISMSVGALVGALALRRVLGAVVPWSSLLRVAVALAASWGAGALVPGQGVVAVGLGVLAGVVTYGGVLLGTRELGRADLGVIRRVVARRGPQAS